MTQQLIEKTVDGGGGGLGAGVDGREDQTGDGRTVKQSGLAG